MEMLEYKTDFMDSVVKYCQICKGLKSIKNLKVITNLSLPAFINTEETSSVVFIQKVNEIGKYVDYIKSNDYKIVTLYGISKQSDFYILRVSFFEPKKEFLAEKDYYFKVGVGEQMISASFNQKEYEIILKEFKV